MMKTKRQPIYVYVVEYYVDWEGGHILAVFGPKHKDAAIALADSKQNPKDGRYISKSEHYTVSRYALNNSRINNVKNVWPV